MTTKTTTTTNATAKPQGSAPHPGGLTGRAGVGRTKHQSRALVTSAEKGCDQVLAAWGEARDLLANTASCNGLGVFHRPADAQITLLTAQSRINDALKILAGIEWPTDSDYDHF